MATLINLRGLHEPLNTSRIIYGFDTFQGLSGVCERDGALARDADLAVPENYAPILRERLEVIESFTFHHYIRRTPSFELVVGDVMETLEPWLDRNPHLIIALAIFDMDIYAPTKFALERIRSRLAKGAVVAFDEVNYPVFPGETEALKEVFPLDTVRLRRSRFHPHSAYFVVGE